MRYHNANSSTMKEPLRSCSFVEEKDRFSSVSSATPSTDLQSSAVPSLNYFVTWKPKKSEKEEDSLSSFASLIVFILIIVDTVGSAILLCFHYLFVIPFRGLVQCCKTEDGDFHLFLFQLMLLVACLGYGFFQDLRNHRWKFVSDDNHVSSFMETANDWLIIIARASGKMTTVFVLAGMLFILRNLTSSFNEIPQYKRKYQSWITYHQNLFYLAMFTASIHTGCHIYRSIQFFTNATYEYYFIGSGLTLWLLFVIQALPNIFVYYKLFEEWFKSVFRFSHIPVYVLFSIVYFAHSGAFFPLAFFFAWNFLKKQSSLNIHRAWYEKKEDRIILKMKAGALIPCEFGYYCQIHAAGAFASYTMVHLQDDIDGANLSFTIMHSDDKPSVLGKALANRIYSLKDEPRTQELNHAINQSTLNLTDKIEIDPVLCGLAVYGPYHSTDMTIREARSKVLVVMISPNALSVAESVVEFYKVHPRHWKTLIILNACSRSAPSESKIVSNSIGKSPVEDFSPNEQLSLWSQIAAKCQENAVNYFQIYGPINENDVLECCICFDEAVNREIHYLVCGTTWAKNILKIKDKLPLLRIHFEEFGVPTSFKCEFSVEFRKWLAKKKVEKIDSPTSDDHTPN